MTKKDIQKLFTLLNAELKKDRVVGELYVVGGAVMCLVFNARPSTKDVHAYLQPQSKMRQAAARVAAKSGLSDDWLNDGVKGFLSDKGTYDSFLELSHLKVFAAKADYLLAMKCMAFRIGEEFQDVDDIRYLLRHLGISTYKKAIAVISAFYPIKKFPQKTFYALEELLSKPTP